MYDTPRSSRGFYGPLPNNGQTYRGYGDSSRFDYPFGQVGFGPYPPAYTQTREYRREERRDLRRERKEERRERREDKREDRRARKEERRHRRSRRRTRSPRRRTRSPRSRRDRGSYQSYAPPAVVGGSTYGSSIMANQPQYLDPSGLNQISIEPCPCTQPGFPFVGYGGGMQQSMMQQPMMPPPPVRRPPMYSQQPVFDPSVYQPIRSSVMYSGAPAMLQQDPRLPLQRIGDSYGMVAPARMPLQPPMSSINVADWRTSTGL
jgi:hypothetical protein